MTLFLCTVQDFSASERSNFEIQNPFPDNPEDEQGTAAEPENMFPSKRQKFEGDGCAINSLKCGPSPPISDYAMSIECSKPGAAMPKCDELDDEVKIQVLHDEAIAR